MTETARLLTIDEVDRLHSIVDRDLFWRHVIPEPNSNCWLWIGAVAGRYGHVVRNKISLQAHRIAYEIVRGPIPDGLVLDHLCRVSLCVNPAHLQAVTQQENVRRGNSPPSLHGKKTQCKHGHPFDLTNTGRARFGRRCLQCHREWMRRYRSKP